MFRELSRKQQNINQELTLLGQYGICNPASSIKHRSPDIKHRTPSTKHLSPGIKHRTPNIQHPSPNIFFKLLKQTQVTSTKNPFYTLSFGYEDTGKEDKQTFGFIFPEKGSFSGNPT
jgi:hypothetical protein